MSHLFTKKVLDINVNTESVDKILEYITLRLSENDKKVFVTTPNPEIIVRAVHDKQFRKILNEADLALPDGVGVVKALKLFYGISVCRVTGVDFMEKVCETLAKINNSDSKRTVTVGFLGAEKGVAEQTADCLSKKYPGLTVVYAEEEWDRDRIKKFELGRRNGELRNNKLADFSPQHIDVLFVAFGAPKQERWIHENLPHIPVTVAVGVGGAFDYISGRVGRAPQYVRSAGFEWLWRLGRQPWRMKRQVRLAEFIWLVGREYFERKITQN